LKENFLRAKRSGNGVLKRSNGDVYFRVWKEEKFEEFNKGISDSAQNGTVISKKRKAHESELDNEETGSKQSKIERDSEL